MTSMNFQEIDQLEAKLRDNPNSMLFARLADHYVNNDEIEKAIQLCRRGIENHPGYSTGHFVLAKSFYKYLCKSFCW